MKKTVSSILSFCVLAGHFSIFETYAEETACDLECTGGYEHEHELEDVIVDPKTACYPECTEGHEHEDIIGNVTLNEETTNDISSINECNCDPSITQHAIFKYPAKYWYILFPEGFIPRVLIEDVGFSEEDANIIIAGNFSQEIVDELLKKYNYFGHPAEFFYDGRKMTMDDVKLNYWDGIPIGKTYETSDEFAEASSVKSMLRSNGVLNESLEWQLAKILREKLYNDSATLTTNGWMHTSVSDLTEGGKAGHEGVDFQKYGDTYQFYSLTNGTITIRQEAVGNDGIPRPNGMGVIQVTDSRGIKFNYAHCSDYNQHLNQAITVGTPLAKQGGTGGFPLHVHLEAHAANDPGTNGSIIHGYGTEKAISPYLAIKDVVNAYGLSNPCPHDDITGDNICDICGVTISSSHNCNYYSMEFKNNTHHGQKCSFCNAVIYEYEHSIRMVKVNEAVHEEKCMHCGYTASSTPHSYEQASVTKEANCTVEGNKVQSCSQCGFARHIEIPRDSTKHINLSFVSKINPTCATQGYELYRCSCGHEEKRNIVPKTTNHVYSVFSLSNATCTAWGNKVEMCYSCGNKKETATTAPLLHNYSWTVVKNATCYSQGQQIQICNRCNAQGNSSVISKTTNHVYSIYSISNATCTEWGKKIEMCYSCGDRKETSTTAPLNHDYVWTITKNATCSYQGQKVQICNRCNAQGNSSVIPKTTSHVYSIYSISNATCTTWGNKVEMCYSCGNKKETATTAPLLHNYSWTVVKNATCYSQGQQIQSCSRCGIQINSSVIPKTTNHVYSVFSLSNATCTTWGNKVEMCYSCGNKKETATTAPLLHNYSWVVTKNATCTSTGTKVYKCNRSGCGYVSQTVTIPLAPHTYGIYGTTICSTCNRPTT